MRKDAVGELLGVQRAQLDNWRRALGNVHERADPGVGGAVWIFAPQWFPALCRLLISRAKKQTARDELLDEDSEAAWQDKCFEEKYYELRDKRLVRERQLVPIEEVNSLMAIVGADLHAAADGFCGVCLDRYDEALQQVEAKCREQFGGFAGGDGGAGSEESP